VAPARGPGELPGEIRLRAPRGPSLAVLLTVGGHDLFAGLVNGADYLFAGVVPQLPARLKVYGFFFASPGSKPTVIRIAMA
jgi:hypothetical protein